VPKIKTKYEEGDLITELNGAGGLWLVYLEPDNKFNLVCLTTTTNKFVIRNIGTWGQGDMRVLMNIKTVLPTIMELINEQNKSN
jgi:hypothetical protein